MMTAFARTIILYFLIMVGLMHTELRIYFHEQMHMIRHDLHLNDINMVLIADFLYEFL